MQVYFSSIPAIRFIDGLPTYYYYSYEQPTIAKKYCLVGMLDIYDGLSCEAQR
jgi:hypothetical protein